MSEKRTMTVEGLRLCVMTPPFEDYGSAMVDFDGPWHENMLEAHEDIPDRTGLAVWEGSCFVTVERQDEDDCDSDALVSFRFSGSWRPLSSEEVQRLGDGRMPLRNIEMPAADNLIEVM